MKILGIETSCDETAASVVEDGRKVISNVVASQIDIHARYGGVVPEVASRQHLLTIIPVINQATAGIPWQDISGVAVTFGPG
ncbi:MAG TPA: tRNA (adenosine(37)-N6)-threonylcarbamoyltransferase complex transferase subunit TsaD, partial [Dehalococcoidia bacterium]|nr:tRNA (adenosine(37)-N6)-threonylcarbamoyltransferase complex transferase subunit TsaD [Dehalococcoidia bacterium]